MANNVESGLISGAMTRGEFGESDTTINYFENYVERVIARIVNIRVDKTTYTGSGVFILSNSSFGVLGSNQLGLDPGAYDRVRDQELYMWEDYNESFTGSEYKDVGSTTAVGWDTGSLSFDVGSVMQTVVLGSDIQLSSTHYTKAYIQPLGSYFWLTQGSVSSDGGITWTPVPTYGEEFTLTSTVGSQPVIRIIDNSGSGVVLYNIKSYFHTDDII